MLSHIFTTALSYLKSQQQTKGNFLSYSSDSLQSFNPQLTYQTIFNNALILSALNSLPKDQSRDLNAIKDRLAQFLLDHKSQAWTWNYWVSKSQSAQKFPLPDDLDDTSRALIALYQYQPQLFAGQTLANLTHTLIAQETQPGGPYRTWIGANSDPKWSDVDLAINANISHLLKLLGINLTPLTQFLHKKVISNDYRSIYYPNSYPLFYFLAPSINQAQLKQQMMAKIVSLHQGSNCWGNPLQTALAVISLFWLNYQDQSLFQATTQYLIKTQQPNGSWPGAAFCYDPSLNNQLYYAGSASLTTALTLQCLTLLKVKTKLKQTKTSTPPTNKLHAHCWQTAKTFIAQLAEPSLALLANHYLHKLSEAEPQQQVVSLPTHFFQALQPQSQISDSLISALSLANLWGWLAYTIYDDVLDQEATVALLSLANIAHRQLIIIYTNITHKNPHFLPILTMIMNQIDLANFKEVTARAQVINHTLILPPTLPDYSQLTTLAEKSLGHALGPIAILYTLGYSRYSAPVQTWLEFMYHYLTAKQLSDDLHDWEGDLASGKLSVVIIRLLQLTTPHLAGQKIKLTPTKLAQLRRLFWEKLIPIMIPLLQTQIKQARQALMNNHLMKKTSFFNQPLNNLATMAQRTLTEQRQAIEFIKTYQEF